jgi:hypothetical protein
MRIITYSDLHLEFGSGWIFPPDANGDVMILAGDIAEWRSVPLLGAVAFVCRSSSESEQFSNQDISRGFWNSGQSPAARSLHAAVAAALVRSRFEAEVPPTRVIDSVLQCHRRDGKC